MCPVLGKMHAQAYSGICPGHTESALQKELKISFYGARPYVTYVPIGGSDFTLIRLFAQKHGFIPKFVPARSADIVEANGTKSGLMHWVTRLLN